VSGSSLTTEQIPYLASGAVGGLFALGVAATLWLSADLRDEFVKLDDIYRWMTGDQIDHQADHQSNGETLGPTEPDVEYASTAARRRPLRARPPMSSDR
jgi:hypothetical protein